jgi:MFS family permease
LTARLDVLRNRDFRLFLVGRLLSTLGVQMQTVAVGWQVYAVTRDPMDLGLIGFSQFVPFIVLILPAGHAADRRDRRRLLTGCFAVECVCALLLLALSVRGIESAWPVFSVMFLFGAARAFAMPAGQALLPNLVPPEQFGSAVALNTSTWQVATIVGPAIGGLLYVAGAATVYGTVAVLLAAGTAMMFTLRGGGGFLVTQEPQSLDALLSGLRFVWCRRPVFGAISLDLFAVLFGGATALLPVYAADVLHVGPGGLGVLRAAPGVGAALCGLVLSLSPLTRSVGRWMFGGVFAFGLSTIVFGVSDSFVLSLAALTVLGAGDMVSVYIRHLLVQLQTPDDIRGRVSAVSAVFIGASNELGEFESGVTAAWWGTVPAVIVGGCATLVVGAIWMRLFPELSRLDQFPAAEDARHAGIATPVQ